MSAPVFFEARLTLEDRGVEMGKDNFPCCEFLARARDYQGWSNAEQPLVQGLEQGLAGAGAGLSSFEQLAPASHLPAHLITDPVCPATPIKPSDDYASSLSFHFAHLGAQIVKSFCL